jgi:hypothetical protein
MFKKPQIQDYFILTNQKLGTMGNYNKKFKCPTLVDIKNTKFVDYKHLKFSFLFYIMVSKFKLNIFLVQYIFYEGPNVNVGHPSRVKRKGARNFIIAPPWAYFHQVNVHDQRLYSPIIAFHYICSIYVCSRLPP